MIVDGDTIYGDGVNVAARIEALCEPGGVWLSRSVYNQVKGKFDLALVPSGLHQVKNISEAVETFRVALDGIMPAAHRPTVTDYGRGDGSCLPSGPCSRSFSLQRLVLLAGRAATQPAARDRGAAVHHSGRRRKEERLADGLTEDLIIELARYRYLYVIARSSVILQGQGHRHSSDWPELDVRYVLQGSLERGRPCAGDGPAH